MQAERIGKGKRLDYYLRLRYSVSPCSVDYWLDTLFEQQKAIYNPPKALSWNQVRKGAGIGFWENAFAFLSDEKTKGIEAKKVAVRRKMQAEVDKTNDSELQRCNAYNTRLTERLQSKRCLRVSIYTTVFAEWTALAKWK